MVDDRKLKQNAAISNRYRTKISDLANLSEGRLDLKREEIIQMLKELEKPAIVYSMAMINYNPSIGRVLRAGGRNQFVEIAWERVQEMEDVHTIAEFDNWHDKFVQSVKHKIGATSCGKPISYGQAQKPVNVFLKCYVDWSSLPNPKIASTLRLFLHVPLDKIVMERVKALFGECCKQLRVESLSLIDENRYYSWQNCFRKICPEKPLLLDVLWAATSFRDVFERMLSKSDSKEM